MRTKISFIFSFLLISGGLYSCFKNEEYPNQPIISNPVFAFSGDSAKLTFYFTDGDGDIGLDPADTLSPYNPNNYYYYNIYVDYYEKDDVNGWQRGRNIAGDSVVFPYRLKPIIVKGKARGIKGTMDITMINFYNPLSTDSDTIKYTIRLIDRALNESNTIETAEIYR